MFLALALFTIGDGTFIAEAIHPPAPPRCYVLVFGGQAKALRPRTAHTWATFVRASQRSSGSSGLEEFTISWLPASLKVRPISIRAEKGSNLTLKQTIDLMVTGNDKISLWGPYEISNDYFTAAAQQKQLLESERVQYRVLFTPEGRTDINNCVHALVRTDPELDRACHPFLWYGQAISQRVVNSMVKVGLVTEPAITHDWLIPVLNLEHVQLLREPAGQSGIRYLLPRR